MTLKIDLDSETRKSLETEADLMGIEAEDLAAQLVTRGLSTGGPATNKGRQELIQKVRLSSEERAELDRLQFEADQRLEQLDLERLDEVKRMEMEASAILDS